MSAEALAERWNEHVGWVAEEAAYMAIGRHRFRQIERWLVRRPRRRIVNRNPQAFGWIARLWADQALMYVRRELDDQHGVINLNHLLHEIEQRRDVLPALPRDVLIADPVELRARCAAPFAFAQREVAHRTPANDLFLALSELDTALESIFGCVQKLHLLVTGRRVVFRERRADPEWLQAFTVPWYRPGRKMATRIRAVQRQANR